MINGGHEVLRWTVDPGNSTTGPWRKVLDGSLPKTDKQYDKISDVLGLLKFARNLLEHGEEHDGAALAQALGCEPEHVTLHLLNKLQQALPNLLLELYMLGF